MPWFGRLSLAQRFSLLSFILIFGAMFIVASWTGGQIRTGVINRTADLTALYVDSLIAHHLQEVMQADGSSAAHAEQVRQLLGDSPLGQTLAGYKIWSPDGRIVYRDRKSVV